MGKLLKRVGETDRKQCDKCNTVWCDDHVVEDQHGYGKTTCPFCHAKWEPDLILKNGG